MFPLLIGLIHTWGTIASLSHEVIVSTPQEEKEISITFDDGPHPTRTIEILDILHAHHTPATFFVLGSRIPRSEKILRRMILEWYTIGNHSYSHPDFRKIETARLITEIVFTDIKILTTTGIWPHYFRFPYGSIDPRIRYAYDSGIVAWSVDAYDWKAKNPHLLAKKIIAQVHSGSIILLHDIKKDTTLALDEILTTLEIEGYHFVSLDRLLREQKQKKNMIFYTQTFSRNLPPIVPTHQREVEIYHPRGTEGSEESLRW